MSDLRGGAWYHVYQVYLDGKPVFEVCGKSKKKAVDAQLADEWSKVFPGQALPSRRRFTLERAETCMS